MSNPANNKLVTVACNAENRNEYLFKCTIEYHRNKHHLQMSLQFLTRKGAEGGGHVPVFLIRNALRHIAPFIILHLAKPCFHLFMTLVLGEKSSMIQGTSGKLKDYTSSGTHKGEKNHTGF